MSRKSKSLPIASPTSPHASACAEDFLLSHGSGVQFGVTHTTGGYDGNFSIGFGMLPCHSRACAVPVATSSTARTMRREQGRSIGKKPSRSNLAAYHGSDRAAVATFQAPSGDGLGTSVSTLPPSPPAENWAIASVHRITADDISYIRSPIWKGLAP